MARYVYVLVAGEGDRYTAMCQLSATSVRGVDPSARITVLTDQTTAAWLNRGTHHLRKGIDDVVAISDGGSNRAISRVLKTTMLQRVREDFIFLDTDTLVVKPIAERFSEKFSAQMALDRFPRHPEPGFPDWLRPHYESLGWSPTRHYYNSGVMFVRNDDTSQKLFEQWHLLWQEYSKRTGKLNDQPSLNRAIDALGISVGELPLAYNAMVRVDERYRRGAKVLHFFAEAYSNDSRSEYERLIRRAQQGEAISAEEIQRAMSRAVPLVETWSVRRYLELGNVFGAARLWWYRDSMPPKAGASEEKAAL